MGKAGTKGNETGKGTEVDPGVINQTKSDVFRRIRGRTTSLWDFLNRKRCKKAAGKQIELRLVSGKKNSCVNHRIKRWLAKTTLAVFIDTLPAANVKTKIIEGSIQMTSYDIPYWKKYTLSIEEAASYFRIGEGKLRKLVSDNPNAEYLLEWESCTDKTNKIWKIYWYTQCDINEI